METAILARHAESELNVREILNGDRSVACGLTEAGREQALLLGGRVRPDVAITSSFQRARETAAIAWPDVRRIEDEELDEISFGGYEGGTWHAYHGWAQAAGPLEECPGGGESRARAVGRYARAFRRVLERPEPVVAVVAHGLVVRYALLAADRHAPQAVLDGVPPAEPYRFDRARLEGIVAMLEDWLREPVWR